MEIATCGHQALPVEIFSDFQFFWDQWLELLQLVIWAVVCLGCCCFPILSSRLYGGRQVNDWYHFHINCDVQVSAFQNVFFVSRMRNNAREFSIFYYWNYQKCLQIMQIQTIEEIYEMREKRKEKTWMVKKINIEQQDNFSYQQIAAIFLFIY